MKARSNLKQAILTILALLVPMAIFIAATPSEKAGSLKAPDKDPIPVAFLISDGAVVIDFCGPWEVFRDVSIPGKEAPFRFYTRSEKADPNRAGGEMKIVPDYTFANAPA